MVYIIKFVTFLKKNNKHLKNNSSIEKECLFLAHQIGVSAVFTHMRKFYLTHLSLKTSCSIGKTLCGISSFHPHDLLIPST